MRQQINLFNPALAPKTQRWPARVIVGIWAVCAATAIVLYGGAAYVTAHAADEEARQAKAVAALQAEVVQVSQQVGARKPDAALVQRQERVQSQLGARRQALARIDQRGPESDPGVSDYFMALSRQVLQGVWLTGLTIERSGSQIELHGRATDPQLLPRYLSQLRNEDVLRGHGFGSVSVQQPATNESAPAQSYVEFRMSSSAGSEASAAARGRP